MPESWKDDLRLIEAGFPCHQVGAETQRERGASSALPPLYFLHVWWARRPLTPSRAAILASLLPADTDPDWFLRELGIEKRVVNINGAQWTLTGKILDKIQRDETGLGLLIVDQTVLGWLEKENLRQQENQKLIDNLRENNKSLNGDPVLLKWEAEIQPLSALGPHEGEKLTVKKVVADPAWAKERIEWENTNKIRTNEDKYGYSRAYSNSPVKKTKTGLTILDPTAGGGSIPFEALRLGHKVIANELNPVATVILHATLEYPAKYGPDLEKDIKRWGSRLREKMISQMDDLFPASKLSDNELHYLKNYLKNCPEHISFFQDETLDGFLYCRQVTCPNCNGDAPLLNTCWLSKEDGKQWGIKIIPDGRKQNGTVRFETYRVNKEKGSGGEDPNFATVKRAIGLCIQCRQAIDADEIKAQAPGESSHGTWKDRLYCVVAVRFQPKLDKNGKPQRFKSGEKAGEIKTEKIRFFRPPNRQDLEALNEAEKRLKENWDHWDSQGLIPTEKFPQGNDMRPVSYGMPRWCDMFTPRQLLGHLILIDELKRLKPQILLELGNDKGRAVITYLQFAIDKVLTYNGKQSRWHFGRGVVTNAFERHDFSLKWTPTEMILCGPNSGFSWGLSQIIDSYKALSELVEKTTLSEQGSKLIISNNTAANLDYIKDTSVDLVCIDPPYYNNVQYAELSDFFYVWHKRTLKDLYPKYYQRHLTNKIDEAVANPYRDGSLKKAKQTYENMMGEIFREF
jgi:putative DNA methylase